MIFRPKYLSEKSRNQLRSCNIPDKAKTKNRNIEMSKKGNFTLLTSAPPPSWQSSELKKVAAVIIDLINLEKVQNLRLLS